MAHGGEEWAEIVKSHNSGTYNNQYMVFDSNKYHPGVELQDEALYVVCPRVPPFPPKTHSATGTAGVMIRCDW